LCVTDEIAESWFAPAGFTRGRLTKPTDVEINLGQGDRDAMYSDGNVINPIVNFPQQGITIFGQRTTQRAPSALDRINVRRMMLIIRKIILRSTRQFAFEPNDPQTWDEIQSLTTSLIDPIARRRGITEYKVQCDSTTNTPDRIEKGELWCKVVIRPTKTAEIIVFELNLINQSASIS
jgi:phage tail sheath protein FI